MKAKKRLSVRWAILSILLVVFCVSVYMVTSKLLRARKEDSAFADLITQVEATRQDEQTGSPTDFIPGIPNVEPCNSKSESEPAMLSYYVPLFLQNQDLFGWIKIEDTTLNYPVMHTPEDPDHYLRRAFDDSSSLSGVPFLDGNCFDGCGNYLIYGHNMKNGTMFATVPAYAEQEYWQEHPVICFDTLYETGTYEVIAAFYSKVYSAEETNVFRYYEYTDLRDPAIFAEYVRQIKSAALYDTGIDAEYGSTLLTLSTCEYHTANGRFVVVAKRVEINE